MVYGAGRARTGLYIQRLWRARGCWIDRASSRQQQLPLCPLSLSRSNTLPIYLALLVLLAFSDARRPFLSISHQCAGFFSSLFIACYAFLREALMMMMMMGRPAFREFFGGNIRVGFGEWRVGMSMLDWNEARLKGCGWLEVARESLSIFQY